MAEAAAVLAFLVITYLFLLPGMRSSRAHKRGWPREGDYHEAPLLTALGVGSAIASQATPGGLGTAPLIAIGIGAGCGLGLTDKRSKAHKWLVGGIGAVATAMTCLNLVRGDTSPLLVARLGVVAVLALLFLLVGLFRGRPDVLLALYAVTDVLAFSASPGGVDLLSLGSTSGWLILAAGVGLIILTSTLPTAWLGLVSFMVTTITYGLSLSAGLPADLDITTLALTVIFAVLAAKLSGRP